MASSSSLKISPRHIHGRALVGLKTTIGGIYVSFPARTKIPVSLQLCCVVSVPSWTIKPSLFSSCLLSGADSKPHTAKPMLRGLFAYEKKRTDRHRWTGGWTGKKIGQKNSFRCDVLESEWRRSHAVFPPGSKTAPKAYMGGCWRCLRRDRENQMAVWGGEESKHEQNGSHVVTAGL